MSTFEFVFVQFLEVLVSSSLYLNSFSVSVLLSRREIQVWILHTEESQPFLNWKLELENISRMKRTPKKKKKKPPHTLLCILKHSKNESKCETTEPAKKDISRLSVS